ncbi:kanadaptin isoform X2 [Dendropsophus ebraccatus]|uniref:kanadaptin isoform X2 n=1 Tax=Dendropsophus ebraccatus TaxID=150705 RepID=UPI003831DD50
MEAAQLSPHDGERPDDPGTLGTRDSESNARNAATCHADGGPKGSEDNEGPYDAGATRHEDSRTPSNETSGSRHDAGARSPRAPNDEGSGTSSSEGPKDSGAWSDQGHGDARTCSRQTSGDPRARITETTGDARARDIEGPRAWCDETTGDWDIEGPRARSGETTGDRDIEGPRDRDIEGPRARSDETAGGPGSSFSKGISPTSNAGPRDSGIISQHSEEPENARDGASAVPHNTGVRSPDQRITESHDHEGTHAARTCHEGSNVVVPAQSSDAGAKDPTEQPNAEFSKGEHGAGGSPLETAAGGAESFKKPIAPSRSSGNEKTLDQCVKPSGTPSSQPPPLASRETASNGSSRLPSDAYRASPAIPYREPAWSGLPEALYSLEVLKGGSILSTKSLNGASWTVFGRLPTCHVSLEHPSVSRYHAILQYRSVPGTEPDEGPGFYVFDLGSTHGTFINKQRIQPKSYCRFRVGHVLKFGGSTRLFVLQGPDEDQEAESELTVTQIKEARRQKESLQKRMLGDDSDEEDLEEDGEEKKQKEQGGSEETGCMWGMGEDAEEEEEENDVNPIAIEYQAEREALYSGNPKKALQGFFDREGEELDFEYEEQGIGSWLCRVKLPVDDSSGKQLVAEVIHSGKKRDAMRLCCMEACRMLDMRGLLRQEAVSRKRKAKQWEAEDFYDSDDDTFLDRTGIVEKKRLNRMKKAGKIEEKPETFESLTTKLDLVEKEIAEIATKLRTNHQGEAQTSTQDSLDAFMTEIKSGSSLDNVTRKKLHLQSLELRKEQQRLKSLIKLVQPTKLPELKADPAQDSKTKKLTLPMFGAMKGGSKFKLKTGTVGRLPPKRTDLPSSLFTMKGDDNEPEEEEEEEDEEEEDMQVDKASDSRITAHSESIEQSKSSNLGGSTCPAQVDVEEKFPAEQPKPKSAAHSVSRGDPNSHKRPAAQTMEKVETAAPKTSSVTQRKMLGPSRPPPGTLSSSYPEDDPDYCVWTPPTGQTGDGKTHLNEKYGY